MSDSRRVVIEVSRYVPERDDEQHWQRFEVDVEPGMTVLEGLHRIREQHDATLAWRHSCRMGICGSCAMVINGAPGLACNTQILQVAGERLRLEPLWNFPVVKDLVTDLQPMFDQHKRLKPYVIRDDLDAMHERETEYAQTPDELLDFLQFSYCIKCGACVSACPTVAMDERFPGPMPLTAAHRYNADSRDDGYASRMASVEDGHGPAHCHYAGECSRVCPKGVDPAKAIQLMKREAVRRLFGRDGSAAAPPVARSDDESSTREPIPAPPFTVER